MMLIFFGAGSLIQRDLDKESRLKKVEEVMIERLPRIEETLARIDERTKKL